MSVCKTCGLEFHRKGSPGATECGSCRVSRRRWKQKLRYVEMLGGKCNRCGYDEHPAALQFHHIDPTTKSFAINGNKLLLNEQRVLDELNKCELLCANCHAKEHCMMERFVV